MNVEQVVMFRDIHGQLHGTEAEAKHENGRAALQAELEKTFGSEPSFTMFDVLKYVDDWYICKLEGSK